MLTLDGDDVVVDWSTDPVAANRFKIYALSGPDFSGQTLIGTTDSKQFRDVGAGLPGGLVSYRVSALNDCAEEGALK